MKNRNIKFIFFGILLLISVFLADNIFAAPSKRATKSKSTSSRKKNKTTVANTASTENLDDERAGSTTARARGTISTTTTSTTAVDDDTAAELLASNLLACINSACYGDVPYEKCFKTGVAETYIRANSECLSMYNGAKSDLIRIKAKNLITTKIKSYFADSCSSAGGKVSGDVCKVQICYFAKAGGNKQNRCQDFNVGKSFTCSYQAFGLTDKDMEYQEEMTGEQMGMIVNAGINAFTGLLQTGMSVADTVIASKELKKKSRVKGKDCKFTFSAGTEHITTDVSKCKEEWTLCGSSGTRKECDASPNKCDPNNIVSDSAGNYYCKSSAPATSSSKIEIAPFSNFPIPAPAISSCNSVKTSDWGHSVSSCYVEFSEWTDLAVKEKEAELYKKFTDFKTLQIKDQLSTAYIQGTTYNAFYGNKSSNNEKDWCEFPAFSSSFPVSSNCLSESVKHSDCTNLRDKTCEVMGSSNWNESKNGYDYSCKCTAKSSSSSNNVTINTEQIKTALDNINNGKSVTGSYDPTSFATNNYSSAVETYNSMQKSVNEEKNKIKALEEKKQSGLSNAIASGASTLVQSGGALTTAIVAAKSNTATMTGACYIGDPENGGSLFANEGAAKKLTWSNL
ncbi:hypothetical protein HDR60_02325 [bacterium]|nr:hypothetical protein [bacterium]